MSQHILTAFIHYLVKYRLNVQISLHYKLTSNPKDTAPHG